MLKKIKISSNVKDMMLINIPKIEYILKLDFIPKIPKIIAIIWIIKKGETIKDTILKKRDFLA